jgi:hypothetical protein
MRVLILSDSHGRKMGSYLRHLDRHIDVRILSLGQKLPSVRGYYRSELRRIQRRIPDVVLIHLGHNDLMLHNKHNPDPLFITVVFHQILEFVAEIEHDLPRCKILVSSLLPRVPGDILGIYGTGQYNRMAYRFYKMLRSLGNQDGAKGRPTLTCMCTNIKLVVPMYWIISVYVWFCFLRRLTIEFAPESYLSRSMGPQIQWQAKVYHVMMTLGTVTQNIKLVFI